MINWKVLVGGIILVGLTVGLTKWLSPPDVIYQTEHQQEQIDSLSVALQNTIVSERTLRDSLASTTKAFRERLERSRDEIATLTRITGRLRLQRDSLESEMEEGFRPMVPITDLFPDSASNLVLETAISDTNIARKDYFGGNLLEITSRGGVEQGSLFLDPPSVQQLRPVRLDVAITISEDRSNVTSLVTSPDFDSLRVQAITPIKPKKKFPWKWVTAAGGFVLGVILD